MAIKTGNDVQITWNLKHTLILLLSIHFINKKKVITQIVQVFIVLFCFFCSKTIGHYLMKILSYNLQIWNLTQKLGLDKAGKFLAH